MSRWILLTVLSISFYPAYDSVMAAETQGGEICYADRDGDGFGAGEQVSCEPDTVFNNRDCNDDPSEQQLNGLIYTGLDFNPTVPDDFGSPYCGDGLDHDCDGYEAANNGGDDDGDGLSYDLENSSFFSIEFPDCDDDIDDDNLTDSTELFLIGTNPEDPDSDGDTYRDDVEVGDPSNPRNSDNDGSIDALDRDDDNDGLPTIDELDDDSDGDQIPNYRDDDDDGDGIPTFDEDLSLDGNYENDDSDDDQVPNYLDADDDGDSIPTLDEDVNRNGDPTDDDSDLDRVPDYLDADSPSRQPFKDGFERPMRLVFATSGVYNGDLKTAGEGNSGLEGGDNICNSLAQTAGLPGTYSAWLSAARISAQDRITRIEGPYYLPSADGKPDIKVVDDFADALECEGTFPNRICLDAPINRDENGATVRGRVWTYTRENGNAFGDKDQDACGGWESSNPGDACGSSSTGGCGRYGESASDRTFWTSDSFARCDAEMRLYCFQD